MSGIEFFVPDETPKTDEGENLKKLIQEPVELNMISDRGLGTIDGKTLEDRAAEKLNAEETVEESEVITDDAPCLEVEKPQLEVEKPQLMQLTRNQQVMTQRAMAPGASDDPAVLLQGMLQRMPGVDNSLAADMTVGADSALYNLSVKARRMHNLEQREQRRAQRTPGAGKKRRRR
jgi:hypothetical protein